MVLVWEAVRQSVCCFATRPSPPDFCRYAGVCAGPDPDFGLLGGGEAQPSMRALDTN